jgi:hypothetical protein
MNGGSKMKARKKEFFLAANQMELPAKVRRVRNASVALLDSRLVDVLFDYPNVTTLSVLRWIHHDSFQPLARLTGLRNLDIRHFPRTHSLKPLAKLIKLETLTLRTHQAWYGSKRQRVDSLRPLRLLKNLRTLEVTGITAEDGQLSPLYALSNLRVCRLTNDFSQEQLAKLANRLPKVHREGVLLPFYEVPIRCKKCGTKRVVLSGSDIRPRLICAMCQEKKFASYVGRYEEIARGRQRAGK